MPYCDFIKVIELNKFEFPLSWVYTFDTGFSKEDQTCVCSITELLRRRPLEKPICLMSKF